MKHIYIITTILSSLFIYTPLYAKDRSLQYAFYIPQDAFQYNTFNNTQQPIEQNYTLNKNKTTSNPKTTKNKQTDSINQNKNKKIKKQKPKTISLKNENTSPSPEKKAPIKNIVISKVTNTKTTPKEKSISEIFSEIPYPNKNNLKHQNAYLDYIMSLRVLHRIKKLQPNTKLEKTLSKANTIRRFDI